MRRFIYLKIYCALLLCSVNFLAFAESKPGSSVVKKATKKAEITVSGKVTSDTGEELVGVNVVLKGTTTGTITDVSGNYSLSIPDNSGTLVFSFIGYISQEREVGSQTEINVVLATDVKGLSEVVVIGYGTQKKSVTTAAISSVKAKDLENMPIPRVEQALQGRTSGVQVTANSGQPGAASTVRIRGTTTFNNSNPLYIVDGIQVGGGIDYLNQSDIESIEVLKDAASAAIYGARAANGVVLVTTKQGKSGKLTVNYNGYLGTQAPWRTMDLLNTEEYTTIVNESYLNAGQAPKFTENADTYPNTDWQKQIFSYNAPVQNHELSINGGGEKSKFFTSFGYLDQKGIITPEYSHYKRFTARFNSTHKITDKITFGENVGYSRITATGIGENSEWGSPLTRAINLDPTTPVVENRIDYLTNPIYASQPVVMSPSGWPYGISTYVTSEMVNPIAELKVRNENVGQSDKIVGNIFGEVELVKGLKFRSQAGVDLAFWNTHGFSPAYYLNPTNTSAQTVYNRNANRALFWTFENFLSYSKSLGDHSASFLVGTSAQANQIIEQGGTVYNIPARSLEEASLKFQTITKDQRFYGSEGQDALQSYFGRITYDFKEKYLFQATVRRDGSSRFGPENKYGTFPSASLGWVVSKENFFPINDYLNFLKLRASWGVNGNNQIGDFRYLALIAGGRNYTFGEGDPLISGWSPGAIANPGLKWEEVIQTDFGLDAVLFNDFTFTADYFVKKTSGLLFDVRVPDYSGSDNPPAGNVAEMENRGLELEMSYKKNIAGVNFSLNANATYLTNKVTKMGEDKKFLELQGFGVAGDDFRITRITLNEPFGHFFGYKTNGIFQDQGEVEAYKGGKDNKVIQPKAKPGDFRWVDVNNDGQINADDRTVIGNPTPDWSYGLTLNADYKGVDLLIFGQGMQGNDVFSATRRFDLINANYSSEVLNRWTGKGSTNSYPRVSADDNVNKNFSRSSDFYIKDGSYFRIKTVQVGYSLPKSIVEKAALSKIRLYLMANNLFTFTKYSGLDPEIGGGSFGVNRGIYPQARALMAGVNLTF